MSETKGYEFKDIQKQKSSSEIAVKESIAMSLSLRLEQYIGEEYPWNKFNTIHATRLHTLLDQSTNQLCEQASIFSLKYLNQRYPDEFKSMFLAKREVDKNKGEFFPRNRLWPYHTYGIVKDQNDRYMAFSPANTKVLRDIPEDELRDALLEPIVADDLEILLSKISELEGIPFRLEDLIHVNGEEDQSINQRMPLDQLQLDPYYYDEDKIKKMPFTNIQRIIDKFNQ